MNRKFGVILVSLVLLMLLSVSSSASGHSNSKARYWPPLLDPFGLKAQQVSSTSAKVETALNYSGGGNITYHQLGSHDVIPGFRVTLYLPKGVHILKSRFAITPPNNGVFYPRVPASSLKWSLKNGRPTWVFYKLDSRMNPAWVVTVNMPVSMKTLAVGVVATPIGVLHAPSQKTTGTVSRAGSQ